MAAFVGGECVGLSSPKYVEAYDMWQVFLTIYGDSENKPVEFRAWDASTGKLYSDLTPADVTFKNNTIVGTPVAPKMIATTNKILQTIALNKGWNWIAFNNQSAAFSDLNRALQSVAAVDGDELKGQKSGQFSRYSGAQKLWSNATLNDAGLVNTSMYMLRVTNPGELAISGTALNPADVTINLVQGWNWIPYIPTVHMTLKEAMSGLTPSEGDIIKSMTEFAVYDKNLGWIGSLENMNANAGYMYKAAQQSTFNYPATTSLQTQQATAVRNHAAMVNGLGSHASKYEHNASMIAQVVLPNNEQLPEGTRIIAKAGNEVRGIATITGIGNGRQRVFLSLHGNASEAIRFVLEKDGKEIPLNKIIPFKQDAVLGSIDNPIVLTTESGDEISIYPNPFSNRLNITVDAKQPKTVTIMLFNTMGTTVFHQAYTLNYEGKHLLQLDANIIGKLPVGIYQLRMTSSNGESNVFNVIKK